MQLLTGWDRPVWTGRGQALYQGDATDLAARLEPASVHCVVTSPPYYRLRNYGVEGQSGLHEEPDEFVDELVHFFEVLFPALHPTATVWLNLGDTYWDRPDSKGPGWASYANLLLLPWRVAIRLADLGYRFLNVDVWAKPSCNPSPTKRRLRCRWEPLFCMAVGKKHYFDLDAARMPHAAASKARGMYGFQAEGRAIGPAVMPKWPAPPGKGLNVVGANPGDVHDWTATSVDDPEGDFRAWLPQRYPKAHFAVFPPGLPTLAIEAGCPPFVCPTCKAPYRRQTERVGGPQGDHTKDPATDGGYRESRRGTTLDHGDSGVASHAQLSERYARDGYPTSHTTGWASDCSCGAWGTAPATVLDPFAGTGTSLAVATVLGRGGIGFDLSEEYLGWAAERIMEA